MTTITRVVSLLVLTGLLLLTQAASGAPDTMWGMGIPNARGVYTGCYDVETGAVRLIPGSKGCRSAREAA